MADTSLAARILRPRVLLPALAVILIVAAALGAPDQQSAFDRSPPLKTDDARSGGARGIYEVAERLGWHVERRRTPYPKVFDSTAVYAVLNPTQPLDASDAHRLLDAVRRGAGLLVVLGDKDVLGDSLRIQHSDSGYTAAIPAGTQCPATDPGEPAAMWFGADPALFRLWPTPTNSWPSDTTVFVSVQLSGRRQSRRRSGDTTAVPTVPTAPAAIGFPLGAGRVVALADADLLRNDVIRICRWGLGVSAVRELEWVSRGARPVLVFDEFHQEEPEGSGTWTVAWAFLTDTAPGHAVLQAIVAGLILLVALGIRPVVPRAPERIERRSALEHVEALARAYAQAGATKVATRRLLRGLRRRHAHGVWRAASDERFLDAVAQRHPAVTADTRTLLDAAGRSLTPAELLAVGQAVDHIDRTLEP